MSAVGVYGSASSRISIAALAVGVAFLLLLAVATVVSVWQAIRATRAEATWRAEADRGDSGRRRGTHAEHEAQDKEAGQRVLAEEQRQEADEMRSVAEQQRTVGCQSAASC